MGFRHRFGVLVTLAALSAATAALAQQPSRPEQRAIHVTSTPTIDGVLSDEVWQQPALETDDWRSYNPLHGDQIPQSTTVWVAYDEDFLYFAFKCDDPDPASIKTSVTRRDNAFNDDWVAVSLDALGTGQTAYHLFVNPSGIQMDALNSVAGGEDFAVDLRWDSAGRLTDTGYAIEMRVPLQSIRFKGGENARMGILFFRRASRSGISVSWPAMAPGVWVFERHAGLTFDRIDPRRIREVLPSVTFARHQQRESPEDWASADNRGDVGFSAKMGLTSTITLDATVNPDFSQVESDAFQIEVNQRFPIFFSEKRPFFMEGTGIFALAGAGGGDNNLRTAVHTRRIIDPNFGAKLTGTAGKVAFGVLSAVDDAGDHDRFFNVGRAQYSFGPNNYIGALVTDTASTIDRNSVVGADVKWRLTPTQTMDGFALFSRTANDAADPQTGAAALMSYSYSTEKWNASASAEHYDLDFEMATAFLLRTGITGGNVFVGRSFYPNKQKYPWIQRVELVTFNKGGEDRVAGGGELFGIVGTRFHFTRQGFLSVQRSYGFEHWQQQRFEKGGNHAFGFVQLFRWLSINSGWGSERATYYDRDNPFQGRSVGVGLGLNFQPTGRFTQELGLNYNNFDRESTGERVYTVKIINTKTTYQFTRAFSLRGIVQYDSSRRRVLTDFLSSYEPTPGTVVYVGYGSLLEQRDFVDGQWVPMTGRYRATSRGLFLKASYAYRF